MMRLWPSVWLITAAVLVIKLAVMQHLISTAARLLSVNVAGKVNADVPRAPVFVFAVVGSVF